MEHQFCAIIGSGPAGCSAAAELVNAGAGCIVLDIHDRAGGLSRSLNHDGNTFDVGPHRFFTKSEEVLDLCKRYLGWDLMQVDRLTRILYKGKLFNYPLTPVNALMGLGIGTAMHAFAGYAFTRVSRTLKPRPPVSFEDWVSDSFGSVLYDAFFKHYTEKVWGIPCSSISADWASQRIKGLNLLKAVVNALTNHKSSQVKTLVDKFLYPSRGAGLLYTNIMDHVLASGGAYRNNAKVTHIDHRNGNWVVTYRTGKEEHRLTSEHIISSIPITNLIRMLRPDPPTKVHEAAGKLRFRNHYCVNLVVKNTSNLFPDNWIYVHSPDMRMGRLANYANFSPHMQSSPDHYPITVEFFSFAGDDFDVLHENAKIDKSLAELRKVGLLRKDDRIESAFTVFSEAAYPVIELGYEQHIDTLKNYVSTLKNLQTIGRAGLFQYNNQDHSIMTGILAGRNVLGADYDVWSVNIDAEYHESGTAPDLCDRDREDPTI